MKKKKGFTMPEMILACTILAVITLSAVSVMENDKSEFKVFLLKDGKLNLVWDGNGDAIEVNVVCDRNTLKVTPKTVWNKGENYIFIRETLSNIDGDKLNKNIKYKVNAR